MADDELDGFQGEDATPGVRHGEPEPSFRDVIARWLELASKWRRRLGPMSTDSAASQREGRGR